MSRRSVRPARVVLSILVVMLASIAFVPSAHGQAPGPGATIPRPTPVVPTLPAKAGEVGLTIVLLMLALLGVTGVAGGAR